MTITDEEIQRLRDSEPNPNYDWVFLLALRMADELERLRKENAELVSERNGWGDHCQKAESQLAKARELIREQMRQCVNGGPKTCWICEQSARFLKELSE